MADSGFECLPFVRAESECGALAGSSGYIEANFHAGDRCQDIGYGDGNASPAYFDERHGPSPMGAFVGRSAPGQQGGDAGLGGGDDGTGGGPGDTGPLVVCGQYVLDGAGRLDGRENVSCAPTCEAGTWQEAGPFPSSDACMAALQPVVDRLGTEGAAGSAFFDTGDLRVEGGVEASPEGALPSFVAAAAWGHPDGGFTLAFVPADSPGSLQAAGSRWLMLGVAANTPPGPTSVGRGDAEGWAQSLDPATAALFYVEGGERAAPAGRITLVRASLMVAGGRAELQASVDLVGATLTLGDGREVALAGHIDVSGSGAAVSPGDGGGSSGGGGGDGEDCHVENDRATGACPGGGICTCCLCQPANTQVSLENCSQGSSCPR